MSLRRKSGNTEKIIAAGEEGKKGIKAAKELFREQEAEISKEISRRRENLSEQKRKVTYNQIVAMYLIRNLKAIDWPYKWSYKVAPTDEGVVMEVQGPGPTYFRSAFRTTGDIDLDLNAVEVFSIRAQATAERHGKLWTGKK